MKEIFKPIQRSEITLRERLISMLWFICNRTLYRYTFNFMQRYRRALLRLFGAKIAADASVNRLAEIACPWNLTMGSKASIGEYSWIYALAGITIGARSCVGREVRLITGSHDICSKSFQLVTRPIEIGEAAWIATGSYVLPGVKIGDGAVVAAASVVVKDVEPWTVIGGSPARFIKKRVLDHD